MAYKRQYEMHDHSLTEICALGANWIYVIIGSGNGLAQNRWQVWTTDTYISRLGHNELNWMTFGATFCLLFVESLSSIKALSIASCPPSATYMCRCIGSALGKVMACRLFGAKPLPEPMLIYCKLDLAEQTSVKFGSKYKTFHSRTCVWKCRLRNGVHFVQGGSLVRFDGCVHSIPLSWYQIHLTYTIVAQWWQFCADFNVWNTTLSSDNSRVFIYTYLYMFGFRAHLSTICLPHTYMFAAH